MNSRSSKQIRQKSQVPTVQDAQEMANLLVKTFPGIDAILLCGSVARGDANEWSDVDLVVTSSDPNLTPQLLQQTLSKPDQRISLIYYRTSVFRELYDGGALFIAHIKNEGTVLFDRLGILKMLLAQPFVPAVDVVEEIKAHRTKLAPYTDPRRFNNNFLFCLSHLYSIGKGVIMLGLVKRGELEFNRERAFRRFVKLNPDLARKTNKIAQLRPFYSLVTCRQPETLPFSYKSAGTKMREVVNAIEVLAKRVEGL
jgi:predicted nucleotidyltransferase